MADGERKDTEPALAGAENIMWKKVRNFIREYGLLESRDRVIVAVSGGADSVCLLSVLCRIAAEGGSRIRLQAVHVHHGLRGPEADRDAAFVRKLCDGFGVPLTVVHRNVAEYAREHGLSTEEAGRTLRYEAFEEAAVRWKQEETQPSGPAASPDLAVSTASVKIAIAHHQDDSAETILYHLVRGSGLKGLAGIRPVQGDRIRPLLCVNRGEILDYLRAENLSWCEDSTNASGDYTRNRIRNQILPMLKEEVNHRAAENILHAGEIFAQADSYLEQQAERIWKSAGQSSRDHRNVSEAVETTAIPGRPPVLVRQPSTALTAEIRLDVLRAQPVILRTYVIRRMIDQVTPGWKDITFRHFQQIAELVDRRTGSRIDLPWGMQAVREYEILRIERKPDFQTGPANSSADKPTASASPVSSSADQLTSPADPATDFTGQPVPFPVQIPLPLPGGPAIQAGGLVLRAFSRKKQQEIPKNQYTKWFDYDKIKDTLSVRCRQTGDYLMLPGGGRKAVTRYMIDEKIPRSLREEIPVLAERDHVLWVIGYRISEYYKITTTTETILQVSNCAEEGLRG